MYSHAYIQYSFSSHVITFLGIEMKFFKPQNIHVICQFDFSRQSSFTLVDGMTELWLKCWCNVDWQPWEWNKKAVKVTALSLLVLSRAVILTAFDNTNDDKVVILTAFNTSNDDKAVTWMTFLALISCHQATTWWFFWNIHSIEIQYHSLTPIRIIPFDIHPQRVQSNCLSTAVNIPVKKIRYSIFTPSSTLPSLPVTHPWPALHSTLKSPQVSLQLIPVVVYCISWAYMYINHRVLYAVSRSSASTVYLFQGCHPSLIRTQFGWRFDSPIPYSGYLLCTPTVPTVDTCCVHPQSVLAGCLAAALEGLPINGLLTHCIQNIFRADSRFALIQCETALHCKDVSHWLGASLESDLIFSWCQSHVSI